MVSKTSRFCIGKASFGKNTGDPKGLSVQTENISSSFDTRLRHLESLAWLERDRGSLKVFTNQSFTKNKAVINGEKVQIYRNVSQPRFAVSKNPSVTRCSSI